MLYRAVEKEGRLYGGHLNHSFKAEIPAIPYSNSECVTKRNSSCDLIEKKDILNLKQNENIKETMS